MFDPKLRASQRLHSLAGKYADKIDCVLDEMDEDLHACVSRITAAYARELDSLHNRIRPFVQGGLAPLRASSEPITEASLLDGAVFLVHDRLETSISGWVQPPCRLYHPELNSCSISW
jgi:hypothetical protein